MNLIDTHAHLYWNSYKQDINEVIQRALKAGVSTIINIGVDIEKSQEALKQAQELDNPNFSIYSTVAIHPHEATSYSPLRQIYNGRGINVLKDLAKDILQLEQLYNSDPKKVVGIGECGLDYFFDPNFIPPSLSIDEVKNLQRQLFQAQIDLAKKLKLPLVIHCRDDRSQNPQNTEAWDSAIEMTKDHFGIYHCYSGLPQTTNYLLQTTNFLVSFAANITYPKNNYLHEAVKILPLDRIVLETDSPFLSPQSKRGERNEPETIKEIAQVIADLKGVSLEEVADKTTENAKKLFNIDPSTHAAFSE